ncbi:MAG: nucleotide exchange factor GrpE [Bacteroidetes bacterium]|nr:MAG: nucleotide exchange factor GrpE [Bacteroidota bacterium]
MKKKQAETTNNQAHQNQNHIKNSSEEKQKKIRQESNDSATDPQKEEDLSEKYNELNDKYLRLFAEFDNFRKRTHKEKLELLDNAAASTIKDILPVLDDLERAIKANEEIEDINAVKEGFVLVYNKLKKILTDKGLKEIDFPDNEFDADYAEAITKIPAPSEDLKGKIVDTVEKGYKLNDKVLRHAKVVIGE